MTEGKEDMIRLTIDGVDVEAEPGSTVLGAAAKAGIFIPTLCADEQLEPFGGCRLCIVEIEGMRGLPPACMTRVRDGMKVRTDTGEIRQSRKLLVELMLADHPRDCLSCTRNLHCELQSLAERCGIRERRLRDLPREHIYDDSNAFFFRDMEKCVLCAKCVRACREINGVAAIDLTRRGFDTDIQPFGDIPLA
ncbi:MAG: 2Fe-2S iron-sulfur cluster-binding protein, partial [Pseudomonadota bacterium]